MNTDAPHDVEKIEAMFDFAFVSLFSFAVSVMAALSVSNISLDSFVLFTTILFVCSIYRFAK